MQFKPLLRSTVIFLSIFGMISIYGAHERLYTYNGVLMFIIALVCLAILYFILQHTRITIRYSVISLILGLTVLTIVFFSATYPATGAILSLDRFIVLSGNILKLVLLYSWLTLVSIYSGAFLIEIFRAQREKNFGDWLNELGVGIVCIIILYYFLAMLHLLWLGPWLLAVLTIYSLRYYWKILYNRTTRLRTFSINKTHPVTFAHFLWALAALYGLFLACSTFTYQFFDPDDMRQYISVPLHFLQHGGLVAFSLDLLNQAPQLGAYLVIPLLQLGGSAVSAMNGYFLIATVLIWLVIGKKDLSSEWRPLFAIILLSVPLDFSIYGIRPDGLLTFLLSLAFYNVLKDKPSLFLTGVFAGIGIGIKYNAFLALPALGILMLGLIPWKDLMRALYLFVIGMVFAALPWITFNVITYGNPIHPVQLFSPSINALTTYETNVHPLMHNYLDELELRSYRFNRQTSFIEKMIRVSLIPEGWIINNVGPILLLAFIALLWIKPTKNTLLLLVASAGSLAAWNILQVNQMHYVLFLMPLWSLLVIRQLMLARSRAIATMLAVVMAGQFISYAVLPGRLVHAAHELSNDPVYEKAFAETGLNELSIETAEALNEVEKQNPTYIAMLFDRADIPEINNSNRHIEHNFAATTWFNIAADNPYPSRITELLHEKNITHLVVPNRRPLYKPEDCIMDGCPLTKKMYATLDTYLASLQKVVEKNTVTVYSVPSNF